jgi:D-arabinose 1-dehydrogenase-like Zn-dependent alcohol dehydrogenase
MVKPIICIILLNTNFEITGIGTDGGYAEYMTAPSNAIARIPKEIDPAEAGPLLCAGVTMYS